MTQRHDTPNIIMFPPAIVGAVMIAGFLLDLLYPRPLFSPQLARVLAVVLLVLSVLLALSATRLMQQAGTSVLPMRPTTALITSGPYRWTRNPIYLAEMGVYLAVAAWINGLAPVLLFPVLFILLDRGVVRREESYLQAKFGADYDAFMIRVRRWL